MDKTDYLAKFEYVDAGEECIERAFIEATDEQEALRMATDIIESGDMARASSVRVSVCTLDKAWVGWNDGPLQDDN
jgi:hypothetical protein